MGSPSKEERVLELILENSPLKEWHFEDIIKNAKVTRSVANKWLIKYLQKGMIQKRKKEGRFPYFTVGNNNSSYYSLKRVYALEKLHQCGLLATLLSLKGAKTIIIFGSIARGDWYKDSDIDLFIYGGAEDFDKHLYEEKLKRRIELHLFQNKKELQEVKTGLLKNILNGYVLKGEIHDIIEDTS